MRPFYEHTQVSWWCRLLSAAAVFVFVVPRHQSSYIGGGPEPVLAAMVILLIGVVMSRLTVHIDANGLRAAFGFGWPRRVVSLARVVAVETTRTRWFEGWGIRHTQRGWLWNVAGLDAVLLRLDDGKQVLIGTDEPKRLKAALERALAQPRVA